VRGRTRPGIRSTPSAPKKACIPATTWLTEGRTWRVISSAGAILAATFAVLLSQPIDLLFQFGFAMATGIAPDPRDGCTAPIASTASYAIINLYRR